MIIFKRAADIKSFVNKIRTTKPTIGFVPTMGALHEGHLSLIKLSKKENSLTIVSIFVNPRQFNNRQDLINYPVHTSTDIAALIAHGVDVLFLPDEHEIYPVDEPAIRHYPLGALDTILEGRYRPGHFQGVCQVMDILLTLVCPDRLYLGQKDYQQVMVIKKLIQIKDMPVSVATVPTMREADGLAMSSRNVRLSAAQRKTAPSIYRQLTWIRDNMHSRPFASLRDEAIEMLASNELVVEYLELADASDLHIMESFDDSKKMVVLAAVFAGDIRLIDNLLL